MYGDILITNVVASAVLVVLIYLFDLNEKEPPWTLVRIYVFSILLTFLFGKLKGFLFIRYGWQFSDMVNHYLVAGFAEELLKLIVVMVFVWPLKSFNEESDGIVYYLMVAAGFTVLENIGYSSHFVITPYLYGLQTGEMGPYKQALDQIVMLRMFSGHIFINVTTGLFLGLAKMRHKPGLLVPGFFLAVLIHGTWNLTATSGLLPLFALLLLIVNSLVLWWTIRQSFYFKALARLKKRIRLLAAEAGEKGMNADLIVLLTQIRRRVTSLRRLESHPFKMQYRQITLSLPPRLQAVDAGGEDVLMKALVHVNGLLGDSRIGKQFEFWALLFLRFAVVGFLLLSFLLRLMV